ncbi:MAG: ABC transporter permease [Paludibacteraceae bacterium]|nr:ABC transporter permease [Paludibacteraceae bacterium]
MNYRLFIAIRYLFSKKRHNTINLITWVSMMGVAIGTMALIVVLSVMNGFESLVQNSFSAFDPSLKILPREGKAFSTQDSLIQKAKTLKTYNAWCEVIEQDGLVAFKDQQTPAIIKGVDYNYGTIINSETIMWDGTMEFDNAYNNQNLAAIGIGLAERINSGVDLLQPLTLYAPKNRKVNLARPDANFTQTTFYNNGIFCVMQPKYDDNLVVMPINIVRKAYQLSDDYVTSIEIKCIEEKVKSIKKQLKAILSEQYIILDQYEQQADFYRITKIEKWTTFMILCFIVMIATFNIIGSLSMIIIEKKEDIALFNSLGATRRNIQKLFIIEGTLISTLGMTIGAILGIILVLLQQQFGFITTGTQIYPVELQLFDAVAVIAIVLLMGFLSSLYTVKSQLKNEK